MRHPRRAVDPERFWGTSTVSEIPPFASNLDALAATRAFLSIRKIFDHSRRGIHRGRLPDPEGILFQMLSQHTVPQSHPSRRWAEGPIIIASNNLVIPCARAEKDTGNDQVCTNCKRSEELSPPHLQSAQSGANFLNSRKD